MKMSGACWRTVVTASSSITICAEAAPSTAHAAAAASNLLILCWGIVVCECGCAGLGRWVARGRGAG